MIKQMTFFPGTIINNKPASKEKIRCGSHFKQLFRGKKVSALLNVNGNLTFSNYLLSSAPADAQITTLNGRLRQFRSKPYFDLLFYQSARNRGDHKSLVQDLSYCRMLLKPGGFLHMTSEKARSSRLSDYFTIKGRDEISWLRQAGYTRISYKKMGVGIYLFSAQRPPHNF